MEDKEKTVALTTEELDGISGGAGDEPLYPKYHRGWKVHFVFRGRLHKVGYIYNIHLIHGPDIIQYDIESGDLRYSVEESEIIERV